MHVTLLVPDLFWPRDDGEAPYRELELPALATLLARSRCRRFPAIGPEAWLCQAFEVERQQDWPVAPVTLAFDGGDDAGGYWLRADPVHLLANRDRLMLDPGAVNPSAEESAELVAVLNGHFSSDGLSFHAQHPARWYLRASGTPRLVTQELSQAAGRNVGGAMPAGEDSLRWRGIWNEIQMLLHEHPVNQRRESRGEPPINSVWLWGGGSRPAVPGHHFSHVGGENVLALALAARIGAQILTGTQLPVTDRSARVLVVAEAAPAGGGDDRAWRHALTAIERAWLVPLLAGLQQASVDCVVLVALHPRACLRFEIGRADLLKFWRRRRPLSAYVPEAA